MKRFDCFDNLGVKVSATILQHAAVRDLLRDRVFEAVFQVWKQSSLVHELGSLQAVQPTTQRVIRQITDCPEQGERHAFADDRRNLQQMLIFKRQSVDTRRQYYL